MRGPWYRRTNVVSEGIAPATFLADPKSTHVAVLVIIWVFLGISSSG